MEKLLDSLELVASLARGPSPLNITVRPIKDTLGSESPANRLSEQFSLATTQTAFIRPGLLLPGSRFLTLAPKKLAPCLFLKPVSD